ncbi:MAG: hypothetical protein HOP18_01175 [Deltaproteobacteria bacterium]|nr:hypothetical protein [Deltaproteobacteria bacterium]
MRVQKSKTVETRARVTKIEQQAKIRKAATRTQEPSRRGKNARHGQEEAPALPKEGQRPPSYNKQEGDQSAFTFVPCSFTGPDGKMRPGWELRVGDMMFGRADSQEALMAYYTRLHEPLPSGHWRERAWGQPQKRKPAGTLFAGHEESEEHEDLLDHEEAEIIDLDTVIANEDGEES